MIGIRGKNLPRDNSIDAISVKRVRHSRDADTAYVFYFKGKAANCQEIYERGVEQNRRCQKAEENREKEKSEAECGFFLTEKQDFKKTSKNCQI